MTTDMFSLKFLHNPALSQCMTHLRIVDNNNSTDVTCGAGIAFHSREPGFTSVFRGIHVAQSSVFCAAWHIIICLHSLGHRTLCHSPIHSF